MSAWADGPKSRTDPALRKALQRWLDAEQEPQTRLDALRLVAEVGALVGEVLDQRVAEARSFRHSRTEIAAAVGITRQSAHRRWRHLDAAADVMAADCERRYRARQPSRPVRRDVPVEDWASWPPE